MKIFFSVHEKYFDAFSSFSCVLLINPIDNFQARRALRALRAVVRIQAIFRGRQVRKQAAVTLRCMQALVRVQARVRARCARMSPEEQAAQKLLDEHRYQMDPIKEAEVFLFFVFLEILVWYLEIPLIYVE